MTPYMPYSTAYTYKQVVRSLVIKQVKIIGILLNSSEYFLKEVLQSCSFLIYFKHDRIYGKTIEQIWFCCVKQENSCMKLDKEKQKNISFFVINVLSTCI